MVTKAQGSVKHGFGLFLELALERSLGSDSHSCLPCGKAVAQGTKGIGSSAWLPDR
jgi:hypothetical protein